MKCPTCDGTGMTRERPYVGGLWVGIACTHCGGSGVVPPSPVHPPPLEPDPEDVASYCEWYATQVGTAAELVKSMIPVRERIFAVLTIRELNGEEAVGIRYFGDMTDEELANHLEQLARLARGTPPR